MKIASELACEFAWRYSVVDVLYQARRAACLLHTGVVTAGNGNAKSYLTENGVAFENPLTVEVVKSRGDERLSCYFKQFSKLRLC